MADNILTKISKLINLGNENLTQKGITTSQTTMREVVDGIADVRIGISEEQLARWAAVNTQLEKETGIYEQGIVPTSATLFTFDGNACTGYVGGNTLPEIIIPRSYSTTTAQETLIGAKILDKDTFFMFLQMYLFDTFSAEFSDGNGHTQIYSDIDSMKSLSKDFLNDCYLTNMTVTESYYFEWLSQMMGIIQFPISVNGQSFNDANEANKYIVINNITSVNFAGTIDIIKYIDGNDYTVTNILGFNDVSGFINYQNKIILLNNISTIDRYAFSGCTSLTSVTIPDSVTTIGDSAFLNCTNLQSLDLSGCTNLTTIGYRAFRGCSGLSKITIPQSVTTIDNFAFNYCGNLKTIVFEEPSQLTSIGAEVFRNCNNLTSILIPSSVTSIDSNAFRDPTGFIMIDVDKNNQVYSSENGILFNKDKTSLLRYPDQKEGTNYTIPEGVVLLGRNAFSGCDNLVTITIPVSVVSTEYYVFSDSNNLVNVYYSGTLSSWLNIDFAYYTSNPLCANKGMTENNLYIDNNKVTEIKSTDFGDMTTIKSNIFAGYTGLVSVEIPNTITSIEDGAFEYCSGLSSIIISDSVTSIETYAFSGCSSLAEITVLAETPPTIQRSTFNGGPDNRVFYVPDASVDTYKTATNWAQYADQIQPLSSKGDTN